MLTSRGILLGRGLQRLATHYKNATPLKKTVRNSHICQQINGCGCGSSVRHREYKRNNKPGVDLSVTIRQVHVLAVWRNKVRGVSYRTAPPPPSKATRIAAELVGGFMWWWVIWHLWHEPEHITGEFEYPDASLWTNAELGIPPDDE